MPEHPAWSIRVLEHLDEVHISQLAELLVDCVQGGASVGFMLPFDAVQAARFWRGVAAGVSQRQRVILIAEDAQGICGTVQLILDLPPNQPHRADLVKMLVHGRVRRQGLGAALMQAVEAVALRCGRSLLVLDAVTDGPASRLYQRLGWVRVGDVPGFALYPDGRPCGTTYFYRDLSKPSPAAHAR